MDKKEKIKIRENSFEGGGAAGNGGGSLNYSIPYGQTPAGGNTTQNPTKFSSSDKTVNHFNQNTNSGSAVPNLPDQPDRVKKNTIVSPAAKFDNVASETKPLDPEKAFDPDVDKLFKKKETPSPDDIITGLQYELSNMTKKDKAIAKKIVLKNLKSDPHFYSELHNLNIDDDKMKVDENLSCFSKYTKTKDLLDKMMNNKNNNVKQIPNVNSILEGLKQKRLYKNYE